MISMSMRMSMRMSMSIQECDRVGRTFSEDIWVIHRLRRSLDIL